MRVATATSKGGFGTRPYATHTEGLCHDATLGRTSTHFGERSGRLLPPAWGGAVDSVRQVLDNVLISFERLDQAFEDRISGLRAKGGCDEKEIAALIKGASAMRDSAGIYLAWARHYIEQLDKAEGLSSDEMAEE